MNIQENVQREEGINASILKPLMTRLNFCSAQKWLASDYMIIKAPSHLKIIYSVLFYSILQTECKEK